MSISRWFLSFALMLLMAAAPVTSFAQSATDTPASASETLPATVTLDQAQFLQLTGASEVAGNPGQVQVSREQIVRLLGGEASERDRRNVVQTLIVASLGFVVVSLAIMLGVVWFVRLSFWRSAANAGPNRWRTYLLQLPLGAPEGSVRALLSLFVVVFGFIVIATHDYLHLGNSEAIAGFVGAVITFYFTSRNADQARKAAVLAQTAADTTATNVAGVIQKATESAVAAQQDNVNRMNDATRKAVDKSNETTQLAINTIARTATAAAGAGAAVIDDGTADGQSKLSVVRDQLTSIQQIARGVSALGVGSEILPKAADSISAIDELLGKVQPLLTGKPDAASVATVLSDVTGKLPQLESAGMPGVIAEATEVLRDVALPIVSGIPGGPIGIVGGVLIAGVRLAGSKRRQLDAFKAAVLGTPFDPVLMPDRPDAPAAQAALAASPLMAAHFPDAAADTDSAMRLMSLATLKADDHSTRNAADIAQACTDDITHGTANVLPPRNPEFVSVDELTHAFDEYLGTLIYHSASGQLTDDVQVPATDGTSAPTTISLKTLADTARQLLPNPKAQAQLEGLVYLGEALSKLPIDKEQVVGFISSALATAATTALVQTKPEESE